MMIRLTDRMPPPPMPWMVRPASIVAMFLAAQQMIVPSVKRASAVKMMERRPKMSARVVVRGWMMALLRR